MFSANVTCQVSDRKIYLTSDHGSLEGEKSKNANDSQNDGFLIFNELRYRTAGKYIITAHSSSTYFTNSSDQFEVIEAYKNIIVEFPNEIMQNIVYLININVKDQFGLNWLDDLEMAILIDTFYQNITVERGSYESRLIVSNTGNFTLTVMDKASRKNITKNIQVEERYLKVVSSYTGEYESNYLFQITVLTIGFEYITVTLDLYCDSDTDPSINCSEGKMKNFDSDYVSSNLTSSGRDAFYFGPFKILSTGTFKFQAIAKGYQIGRSSSSVTIYSKFSKLRAAFTK